MRVVPALLCVSAALGHAQSPDAGVKPLSAEACRALVQHVVLTTVAELLADDPEVKKMSPKEREVTERLAREEALAAPTFEALIKQCPAKYDKKAEACLLQAKSTKELDACVPPARGR